MYLTKVQTQTHRPQILLYTFRNSTQPSTPPQLINFAPHLKSIMTPPSSFWVYLEYAKSRDNDDKADKDFDGSDKTGAAELASPVLPPRPECPQHKLNTRGGR